MEKILLMIAAASGVSAVGLGAFGAHALKPQFDATQLSLWETAVQYQFWHTLALLFVVVLALQSLSSRWLLMSGWCFVVGVVLFSGSLYFMALSELRSLVGFPIGLLTPLGGMAFIAGWLLLLLATATGKVLA